MKGRLDKADDHDTAAAEMIERPQVLAGVCATYHRAEDFFLRQQLTHKTLNAKRATLGAARNDKNHSLQTTRAIIRIAAAMLLSVHFPGGAAFAQSTHPDPEVEGQMCRYKGGRFVPYRGCVMPQDEPQGNQPPATGPQGAIVLDKRSGAYGTALGQDNYIIAKQLALINCVTRVPGGVFVKRESICETSFFFTGCAALAMSDDTFSFQKGSTREMAASRALEECRRASTVPCKSEIALCSSDR